MSNTITPAADAETARKLWSNEVLEAAIAATPSPRKVTKDAIAQATKMLWELEGCALSKTGGRSMIGRICACANPACSIHGCQAVRAVGRVKQPTIGPVVGPMDERRASIEEFIRRHDLGQESKSKFDLKPGFYRKKPVVIQAWRWDVGASNQAPDWLNAAIWSGQAVLKTAGEPAYGPGPVLVIKTLEGDHVAKPGDWIIRGVKGELYPCKHDIFVRTYEGDGL